MYDLIILILAVNHLTVRLFWLFFGVDFSLGACFGKGVLFYENVFCVCV